MTDFQRYAIYHAPRPGPLADAAADWLAGTAPAEVPRPLAAITAAPRRYGFHATLKPPFRLAGGTDAAGLSRAVAAEAARVPPVDLGPLRLARLGRFLALVPQAPPPALAALAERTVRDFDRFRAPATAEETARRRAAGLSPRQEVLLARWGYPYVMEEFRFHLTLTGPLAPDEIGAVEAAAGRHFAPVLGPADGIADLCLFGEAADGAFRLVERHRLGGAPQPFGASS